MRPADAVPLAIGVLIGALIGIATAVVGERVSQYVRDRGSGEPAALLVPARREPELEPA